MADNETSYLPIGTCLEQIEKAVYGREVRQAIHDGIAQCYDDTVEGVNAAQQAASDTQEVINDAIGATNAANTAAAEASNVKVEQTVSGDTVTFTTTKRDGTTVSTSFQKPNIVVSKDEGSGEFSVTAKGWNGEEIIAKIPDPSEEVKSRATIAAVSKVKTALGNPLTITNGMDAPAVKTVVTLEPKQDLHGYDHPWVGGSGKNLYDVSEAVYAGSGTMTVIDNGIKITATNTNYPSSKTSAPFAFLAGVTYALSGHIKANAAQSNYRPRLCVRDWSSNSIKHAIMLPANNTEGDVRVIFTPSEAFDGYVSCLAGGSANNESIDIEYTFIQLELGDTVTAYEPYSNICPIEGYDTVQVTATGKNLYTDALKILSHSIDANGTYNYDSNGCVTEYIPVKGADVIKWGVEVYPAARGRRLHAYDQYGNWLRQLDFFSSVNDGNRLRTVTLTDDVAYVRVSLRVDDVYVFIYTDQSITGFIKDEGSTTSISVAQAAGATVYGGTVTLNEDGSGTLVVDRMAHSCDGSETFVESSATNGYYFLGSSDNSFMSVCDIANTGAGTKWPIPAVSHFHGVPYASSTNLSLGESCVFYGDHGKSIGFYTQYDETSEFKSYLTAQYQAGTPVTFVIPLASPVTKELTADQLRTLTGENHVWTDGTKLELTYRADKYADVEKFLNAIPTGTKTGDPAVFADGADDLPFEKLTIAVEPHQEGSGDPSPDNVRPITGWDEVKVTRTGKNLASPVTDSNGWSINVGGSFSVNGDILVVQTTAAVSSGVYAKSGSALRNILASLSGQYTWSIDVKASASISAAIGVQGIAMRNNVTVGTSWERISATGTFSAKSVPFVIYNNYSAAVTVEARNLQIEPGSTATSYEPYTSTILPISLKYATGSTVYGGTVTINRDGTGSVVVDRAMVDLGTLTWTYNNGQLSMVSQNLSSTVGNGANVICSMYKTMTSLPGAILSGVDKAVGINKVNSTTTGNFAIGALVIKDTAYTDAATFKAAMSGVQLVYELATPTTYTLTAPQLTSLLGNNTVWCDAGQVTVKYKRDIAKAISTIEASLISAGLWEGDVVVAPGA